MFRLSSEYWDNVGIGEDFYYRHIECKQRLLRSISRVIIL